MAANADSGAQLDVLSARERQVLEMASTGLTNGEVARELGVSVHAIKFHLARVYRKLGVTSRREAVEQARAAGLLDPDGPAPSTVPR